MTPLGGEAKYLSDHARINNMFWKNVGVFKRNFGEIFESINVGESQPYAPQKIIRMDLKKKMKLHFIFHSRILFRVRAFK